MNDKNFFRVYYWMTQLDLKPNELLVYAVINNFSEAGQTYTGSFKYLQNTLHVSKQTAIDTLKKLVEKKLLLKITQTDKKGNKPTIYKVIKPDFNNDKVVKKLDCLGSPKISTKVVQNLDQGSPDFSTKVVQILDKGSLEIRPNKNIDNNTNKNINNNNNNNTKVVDDVVVSEICTIYQDNIGPLTPMEAEFLLDDISTYPKDWIIDAISIAVQNRVRRYKYIKSILQNWERDGRDGNKQRMAGTAGGYKGRRKIETIEEGARKWANVDPDNLL